MGFREIGQSGSLLHKGAVDSYFKLISKLESSRNQNFSEQIKYTSAGYFNIINQIMNCLFNEIHNYQVVFSFGNGKIFLESSCCFSF